MSHAGVNQSLFRTPSELIQEAFRVIQVSLNTGVLHLPSRPMPHPGAQRGMKPGIPFFWWGCAPYPARKEK